LRGAAQAWLLRTMIVVTGAAGFIGSNIVASLNAQGRSDIVVCDSLGVGEKWRNLSRSAFIDHVAPDHLLDWLAGRDDIEAVIHMGAISATTAVDGDEILATNFRLSIDLLDWTTTARVPFLYASSAAVYGDGVHGFLDDTTPSAVMELQPLNLYGWSKRQFDYVVADRIATRLSMPPTCVGFRFFNVFGPNEYHKGDMQSLVAKIAGPVGRGERITLFKSHRDGIAHGDQQRDFIYVKDAVDVVLFFLARSGIHAIVNVGTGQARSFRELAEAVFTACGRPVAIEYVDMPVSIRDKYQYFTQASLEQLRCFGYDRVFDTLETSIADYVGGYLSREDPFR
jgi:ADP-L-glycero-D-manno-heptose 6-epimerase